MIRYTELDSPLGPIRVVADGDDVVSIDFDAPAIAPTWVRDDAHAPLATARAQLAEYFAGHLTRFELPLAPKGTPFQHRVWALLREIPYGETTTYGEIARRLGNANASRAVGLANGRNPLAIVVPCHRVIGTGGKLVGYAGGLSRKESLLALEAGRV